MRSLCWWLLRAWWDPPSDSSWTQRSAALTHPLQGAGGLWPPNSCQSRLRLITMVRSVGTAISILDVSSVTPAQQGVKQCSVAWSACGRTVIQPAGITWGLVSGETGIHPSLGKGSPDHTRPLLMRLRRWAELKFNVLLISSLVTISSPMLVARSWRS